MRMPRYQDVPPKVIVVSFLLAIVITFIVAYFRD